MNRYYPPYWQGRPPAQQAMPRQAPSYATAPPPAPAATRPAVAKEPKLLSSSLIKGAAVGAIAAYVLSNEQLQQGAIKAAVKSWSLLQGSVEELKERFRDAEAELHASQFDE